MAVAKQGLTPVELAILGAVPFVMVLGNSMLIPVFPRFEQVLNLSHVQVGLLITAFSLPAGLLIPLAGILSDRIGRKKIITPALILYGLGGLVAGVASLLWEDPFGLILVGRVIQGIGAGGTYQMAMALTGDIVVGNELTRSLGFLEASNGAGKVVSPILGSLAALLGWYSPFFVYSIFALPVAAAVWWGVEEPNPGGKREPLAQYFSTLCRILSRKGLSLAVALLAGLVALFTLFGLLSYLSDILEQRFALRGIAKGLVLAIPVSAMAITSYLTGVFLEGRHQLLKAALVTGLLLAAAALLTVPLYRLSPIFFFAAGVAAGVGIGAILPPLNTLITTAASQDERGIITAVYGTVRFLGVAAGPPAFGAIGFHRLALFLGVAAVAAGSALVCYLLIDTGRMMGQPEKVPAS